MMPSESRTDSVNLHFLGSYDYDLPADRIAQRPVEPRDASRLLCMNRRSGALRDLNFRDLPELLQPGDLLILNNTRVIPARLQCDRGEVLLAREVDARTRSWDAMVFPGKHFKPGTILDFDGQKARVLSHSQIGRILQFDGDAAALMNNRGAVPLPPYIERQADDQDRERYQTVYAQLPGSIAAPTAGLHLTRGLFGALKRRGVRTVKLTLHVGPGTFRPVKSDDITRHTLHTEFYRCPPAAWNLIRNAERAIAVGTTATRAVETIAATGELTGHTSLFIYPGFRFQIVRGLITNFHLPRSSLLMLVSAFGGYLHIRDAYRHAIENNYRFYSYGDAMVIL
jgi:S-adenosylmethionine:tRNA ribosyltransferase-isomerase